MKFSSSTPNISSDACGEEATAFVALPCTTWAPQIAKLQQQIVDLWEAHKKVVAEVAEVKQISGDLKAKVDEND